MDAHFTFCIFDILVQTQNNFIFIFYLFIRSVLCFVAAKNENIHTHIQKFFMILSGAECSIEKAMLGWAGLAVAGWEGESNLYKW